MDELSKEYVISFFDKSLGLHGDRPEAVRWSSGGQTRHYEAMLDVGNIKGKKVLDFGCGKGDLYKFLLDRGLEVEYSGCDINEKLISFAQQKFPEADFRVFDIETDVLEEEYDYIFLCGVFNLKVQGLEETVKNVLGKLFRRCRIALAFNALSSHDPRKDFELNYLSPGDMLDFASTNLSPYVSLRHDRMRYDFVLFVYKDVNQF